jgi:membrane associated rhomboid family serine protease
VIPLRDDNPTRSTPVVTFVLIAINVAAFLLQLSAGLGESTLVFGLIPAELTQGADRLYTGRELELPPGVGVRNFDPSWATIFSSMFMHGSWMHIIGNMWFLWIFGNNVEDDLGKLKFLVFYLVCGVAAALAQVLLSSSSPIPMVGASGAVAGVLGAYIVLHPHSRVYCLLILLVFITTVTLPAWIVLGYWFVLELLRSLVSLGPEAPGGGVAYGAHVGGFIAGWLLVRIMGASRGGGEPLRRYYSRSENVDWR